MNRDDIQIISKHSNWSETGIDNALKSEIYPDVRAWKKFLQLLLLSLGTGFAVAGILFFFAYNWEDLHKFAKIGIVAGLVVSTIMLVLFVKIDQNIKNIMLTGAAVLVGVLFAVFGQVYQTGANAYDFFLGWTVFITLWVIAANYHPLWLIYIVLICTTLTLYREQVAQDWSEAVLYNILFGIGTASLFIFNYLPTVTKIKKTPLWFSNILLLASIVVSTIGVSSGIFERYEAAFVALFVLVAVAYTAGLYYGFRIRSGVYLAVIPFSIIIIISAILLELSDFDIFSSSGGAIFLVIGTFIVASVTLLIRTLIKLKKQWADEQQQ